ncbi:MAG: hypothetical protein RIT27_548 [Pseudomonadota bacterium]|jgi:hypothetical protein
MNAPHRSLHDVTYQAITILNRELGVVDTLRFLSQFNTGQGNYTKDRENLFANLTLEEIITDIKKIRNTQLS